MWRRIVAPRIPFLVALIFCWLLCPQTIGADPIDLVINPTSLTASPSGTVTFSGTITNNTGSALNATDLFFNFGGFDPDALTLFQLLGVPDFSLAAGGTSAVTSLFSVTLASNASNTYLIEAFLQDINGNLSNSITVSVNVAATAVPEPATLLLLSTSLAGAMVLRRRHER